MYNFFLQSDRSYMTVKDAREKYPAQFLIYKEYNDLSQAGILCGTMHVQDLDEFNAREDIHKFIVIPPDECMEEEFYNTYWNNNMQDDEEPEEETKKDEEFKVSDNYVRQKLYKARKESLKKGFFIGVVTCTILSVVCKIIRRHKNG